MTSKKMRKSLDGIMQFNVVRMPELEKLVGLQAADEEVAAWFGIQRIHQGAGSFGR
jgi:hypothetical protein